MIELLVTVVVFAPIAMFAFEVLRLFDGQRRRDE
jgi:hypothetical protein